MSMSAEDILKKLVSFPVLGGQSNLEILAWIEGYLNDYGVQITKVPNEEGNKASMHCRIGPAVDGGIILSGHMDVVPVAGQAWTTDPFVLTDKGDGKLYGRGSCDMKGFLACCLAVVPAMVKANLAKPIYLAFSYDEEIGCLAAPELVEHINTFYKEKPKMAIIGEPSLMQPMVGQKGIYIADVKVNGSAGHSSRIKQEVSAIHISAKIIQWLDNKMNDLVASGQVDKRFHPEHTSLHVGLFKGGIAPNIIADDAYFSIDIRTIPKDKLDDILNELRIFCDDVEKEEQKKYADFKISITENHPAVPPLDTKESCEVVQLVKKISGMSEVDTVSYAAEAGQFSEGGFDSVICGPGSIAQAHRADEFIAKEQLNKGVTMIEKLVSEFSHS